jgi:hypothetical protein
MTRPARLKQGKRGKTSTGNCRRRAKPDRARQVAANSRRRRRNSGMRLNAVLTLAVQ